MKKMIPSFNNLRGAAFMYLEDSFNNINDALENDAIQIMVYSDNFEYSKDDIDLQEEYEKSKENPIEHLRKSRSNITNLTVLRIITRRANTIVNMRDINLKFKNKYELSDLRALSHITNLALFIEIIINRHLYFLLAINELSDFEYNQLEKSSVINKILYITKNKKIDLNFISTLFRLRNFAVHYTATNTTNFNVTIETLRGIWKQIHKILINLESKEKFDEEKYSEIIETYIEEFNERWK